MNICTVCGGDKFVYSRVLWEELVRDWQLSPEEELYINRQQGFHCTSCGNNLRAMALASAITSSYRFPGTLTEFIESAMGSNLRLLEINEAGNLTPTLRRLTNHRLVSYPETDIHCLPFEEGAFDLVIHSDTLEHVSNPVAGLAECRRVLTPHGRCIFTVPVVVGRLSRSRDGLKHSFHGSVQESREGLRVRTEFGADAWTFALMAGFSAVTLHSVEYPAGLAIEATR